jgi:hypothetical protein
VDTKWSPPGRFWSVNRVSGLQSGRPAPDAAHMASMIDRILSSAGTSRSDLNREVLQQRKMSADYEMVPADHFDIEDLATVIETLAGQLERIRTSVAPFLDDPSAAGDLARKVHADVFAADPDEAFTTIRESFNPDLTGVLSSGAERIFGYPDLVLVSHLSVDFETLSSTLLRHLVHTPSGRVFEVPEKASVQTSAEAVEQALSGA